MDGKLLQQQLFERLSAITSTHPAKFSKEIATILGIGSNVVYDRINGKKLLNIEELYALSRHYHISIDDLILAHTSAGFELVASQNQPTCFDDYLLVILKDLQQLAQLPKCDIIYIASETPFFYYMFHPIIAYFKLYVWGRTIWYLPDCEHQFSATTIRNATTDGFMEQLLTLYVQFPTMEFWSLNMIDTTLNQIRYCRHCELFEHPNDAFLLLNELENMCHKMEQIAAEAKKKTEGDTIVLHNELVQSSSLILVDSDYIKSIYAVYDAPNLMISTHKKAFEHTYQYYKKIAKNAFPMSDSRERMRFFRILRNKLNAVRSEFSGE